MLTAWASFAAVGDPGWPAYDTERRLVQRFDTEPAVVADPQQRSRRLWQDHSFPALPLIGD
jgi:para-nitrobenzyl esterase